MTIPFKQIDGVVPVAQGGTNISSYAIGDLLYASGATTLSKLADVAVGQILVSGGVGVAPAYSASLPTPIDDLYLKLLGRAGGQVANGGTAAGENLTLSSTADATKGKILFGTLSAYDEVNDRLGIGTISPDVNLHVYSTDTTEVRGETNHPTRDVQFTLKNSGAGHLTSWILRNENLAGTNPTAFKIRESGVNDWITVLRTTGYVGIANSIIPTAKLHVVGTGATFATYSLKVDNSASTPLFYVRDDSKIIAGTSSYLTIGISSGLSAVGAGFTSYGFQAGELATTDQYCTFIGANAGRNTKGSSGYNTFVGSSAGLTNTIGYNNTFLGADAGLLNISGINNIIIGRLAGGAQTIGGENVYVGTTAGRNNDDSDNVMIGSEAGLSSTGGGQNTYLGRKSGYTNLTGDGNVFIGHQSGFYETGSNKLFIDNTSRTNEALGRSESLLYGVFTSSRTTQTLNFNSATTNKGIFQVWGNATILSLGALVIGQTYEIIQYVAGDDFLNVGASSNATGEIFVATGTTPTIWTNGSVLTNNTIGLYVSNTNNVGIGTGTFQASMVGGVTIKTGTAPTGNVADQFAFYSSDIVAGNAAPHFRTENGDVVRIFSVGGWGTPTGTLTRTTFDTTATTLDEVAERLGALISDFITQQQLLKA